ILWWSDQSSEVDVFGAVLANLPRVAHIAPNNVLLLPSPPDTTLIVQADENGGSLSVSGHKVPLRLAPAVALPPEQSLVIEDALRGLSRLYKRPFISLECGHIHLDRRLDRDQEFGVAIGRVVFEYLVKRQTPPPRLTPLIDDDHVLIDLRPSEYFCFLGQELGMLQYSVIPESSPIVRAIACCLYQVLRCERRERIMHRGHNVYCDLGESLACELIEDANGAITIGCVLFEVALLIYRSAIDAFNTAFGRRYPLAEHIHTTAFNILDGPGHHDERMAKMRDLYSQFADIADPSGCGSTFMTEIDCIRHGPPIDHLNVLEDYYESQQVKVRRLSRLIGLPLRLVTISFNAQSGRIMVSE
ncbi:MAG: hypothetical protein ACREBW_08115, partial [Candidatus Micrarchaeaceae archaeon]